MKKISNVNISVAGIDLVRVQYINDVGLKKDILFDIRDINHGGLYYDVIGKAFSSKEEVEELIILDLLDQFLGI